MGQLFDMNWVYKSYVADLLRRQYPGWRMQRQVTGQALGAMQGLPFFALHLDLLADSVSADEVEESML
ncbi:hypothetical protein [Deinococcus sp. QL22]|uniref:5-methylcytosine restriction system specificity protein McrC n=1 Tax=Deinococcus sp. QL22 TaxID=2939437 RepID=UPI002016E6DD|nr:hypothetical protein [Deinococcus sp. QL22]UQN06493.1 hypothetical protein M1R55_00820 [Deinococcus sp. QL22]